MRFPNSAFVLFGRGIFEQCGWSNELGEGGSGWLIARFLFMVLKYLKTGLLALPASEATQGGAERSLAVRFSTVFCIVDFCGSNHKPQARNQF